MNPDESKKTRFKDGLNYNVTLNISKVVHLTYQSIRDAAIEAERQILMYGSKRRSFEGTDSGIPNQKSPKRSHSSCSFSSGAWGSGVPNP